MEKEIYINGLKLKIYNCIEETIISESTGNELYKISFETDVIGKEKSDILTKSLKDTFEVKISDNKVFRAKTEGLVSSYTGYDLNSITPVNFTGTIIEMDKDLPETHNFFACLADTSIMNWIRTRAISELLIEKGVIEEQEYLDKIKKVMERDIENLRDYILYGKTEPVKVEVVKKE